MAVNTMFCRCLPGLFGPNSAPAPIWGDRESLACLSNTLNTGLAITKQTLTTGQSEADNATQTAVTRLQQAGRIPNDLFKIQNLSDEHRSALGFEPRMLPAGSSMQDWGVPPFQELDLADFLAALRFVTRYSELKSGYKPIFQVGILTMIVQGVEPEFFAQLFVSDAGLVTDTIWLYRWCVVSSDNEGTGNTYTEHWRAFDGPPNAQQQQSSMSYQDQSSINRAPDTTGYVHTTTTSPDRKTPKAKQKQQPPHLRKHPKKKHRPETPHAHLSDTQLFALDPDLIQNSILLRLAQSYSNHEIFELINANHEPGVEIDGEPQQRRVKSVNVITKRLTHAIKEASKASGRSEREIRVQIAEAKRSRGVAHKGKVDVTVYG
jgi:hypothetical protein